MGLTSIRVRFTCDIMHFAALYEHKTGLIVDLSEKLCAAFYFSLQILSLILMMTFLTTLAFLVSSQL